MTDSNPAVEATTVWQPPPEQQGIADVPGGRIWYWDTGGAGPAVVFVHPNAGSGISWEYQHGAFAAAGFRVIGYSRRNYFGSDVASAESPGTASADLHALTMFLKLPPFHLVAVAAGGGVATDFALSFPDALRSLTICSRTAGIAEGPIAQVVKDLKPPQWNTLPRWFQELGPSYRAINPEGVQRWIAINRLSEARKGATQDSANVVTDERLAEIAMPTLLMSGCADLTAPPSIVRLVASRMRNSEFVAVPEAGHSIYWEQPDVFNRIVIDFIRRH